MLVQISKPLCFSLNLFCVDQSVVSLGGGISISSILKVCHMLIIRSMHVSMCRLGLSPGVHEHLYGVTFLSFALFNISLIHSGFLGPTFSGLPSRNHLLELCCGCGKTKREKRNRV